MSEDSERDELARASRRRLAVVQLALGVPTLLLVVIGLVLGFRLTGRPLAGAVFWGMLAPLVVVFAVYYARAILALRRAGRR